WHCASVKGRSGGAAAKTTVADPGEDNYDMKYVKLDLQATNDTALIKGDVTTIAQVSTSSLSTYVFELGAPMTIDSVMIDGVTMPVTTTGDVRTVTLPTPLSAGTLFTAEVFYHGTPLASASFFAPGLSSSTSP